MPRVVVIHYEPAEAVLLADRLRREGFDAEPCGSVGQKVIRRIRENPPDAVLIDLFRMPSYGKAIGALLREGKATRRIPLVFLEGDPEKAATVRQVFPDAEYARLSRIGAALRRAIARPPAEPLLPQINVPLFQKLRIKDGQAVRLVNPPEGFSLPEGVRMAGKTEDPDVLLAFVRSAAALSKALASIAKTIGPGRSCWIAWPKKKAGSASPLTLPMIHEACGALGLVGYKTCSIDDTWSAVVVAKRR